MLTNSKKDKLSIALKAYCKKYLHGKLIDLDESGTRLLINSFLTDVLTYVQLDEIKTEYMIRGTYADYMVQVEGKRYFLVEVKAFSLALSEKHLRQTVNYGANEGVDWALLTNGKQFDLYRIIFGKPIDAKKLFSVDLTNVSEFKKSLELIQFLHRDSVTKKGLESLYAKSEALDSKSIASLLFAPQVVNFIKKTLNTKFKSKFSESDIHSAITHVICNNMDISSVKPLKLPKETKVKTSNKPIEESKPES